MSPRRLAAVPAVLAACAALPASAVAAEPIPNLYGGPLTTCFWNVGVVNPTYINIATADAGASYWAAVYTLPPGANLELRGQYPHARYASVNAYNLIGQASDALADFQLDPDPGSQNPFRPGVRRDVRQRSFTIQLPTHRRRRRSTRRRAATPAPATCSTPCRRATPRACT